MKPTEHGGRLLKLRDIMTTPVLTLSSHDPASDALATMRDERVRHAPVLEGEKILGVLSDRDLGGPHGGLARRHRTVGELMQTEPVVAGPEMTVTEAISLMRDRRIGCLPVVDAGRLLGIVTRTDLLAVLAAARRERRGVARGAADVPRPPLVVSPNRDKWP